MHAAAALNRCDREFHLRACMLLLPYDAAVDLRAAAYTGGHCALRYPCALVHARPTIRPGASVNSEALVVHACSAAALHAQLLPRASLKSSEYECMHGPNIVCDCAHCAQTQVLRCPACSAYNPSRCERELLLCMLGLQSVPVRA